mmetsp:Transcript_36347/g.35238  ORF Transcript_36347/g.35238 Transcript_36347/m.35238 type:complete len:128 (+) Transcript_36347:1055-1438(+)|eukprot:CAMPEP_0170548200 /NCGR_PEP_ID=MMETSP0211-20121228/6532_1 /TAXON_ID=311385 /ORGANISM="Pseudokeronopsis sp., Strain OXSARD2" /LENGTH=127 /DNA_ID=CAMNT_0010853619 /DNA_START=1046 /DNA_END=1429 /DNA_ORIENTATION=-
MIQNVEVEKYVLSKEQLEQTRIMKTRNLKMRKVDLDMLKMKMRLKKKFKQDESSAPFDLNVSKGQGLLMKLFNFFEGEEQNLNESSEDEEISDLEFHIRDVSYVGLGDDYELMEFNEVYPEDEVISD